MNTFSGKHQIANIKRLFFDQRAVVSAMDRAAAWVLKRFGAITQSRAKASIKPASGSTTVLLPVPGRSRLEAVSGPTPAAAGQPPHGESRSPLRRFIWYAYDPSARSVMIGPVRLTRTRAQRVGNAPEALEYGGASVHAGVVYWTTGPRGGAHRHKGDVRVNIRPHPFMRPAFEKTRDKDLDKLWRNSILKAR